LRPVPDRGLRVLRNNRSRAVATLVPFLVGAIWLFARDPKALSQSAPRPVAIPEPFPAGYLDYHGLSAALTRLAEAHPETVRLRSLAKTGHGRDVWLVTVGRPQKDGEQAKAAVLLVANLEADHVIGSHIALGMVERLAGADGRDPAITALLDQRTIHLVPRLNPDGAERLLAGKPRTEIRTNLTALDRDRDRKAGEDGPDDLDGDGLATRMRVKDEKATLIVDAKDARIVRKADPVKGERAEFSEYAEGKDNDGDGQLNEDPAGGINLNRNWPHHWTEFDPEAGYSPASEPEVYALIAWAFDHPEIAALWSFSLNDNLKVEPRKPGSTLDEADLPYFVELCKLHAKAEKSAANEPAKTDAAADRKAEASAASQRTAKPAATAAPGDLDRGTARLKAAIPDEQTKIQVQRRAVGGPGNAVAPAPAAPSGGKGGLEGTTDGALSEWAYHQFGIVALASRLWSEPDLATPGRDGSAAVPPADAEARWLDWNDKVMGGRAFVPFHEVDHPSLGKILVGGWKPGVRLNPPAGRIAAIVDVELAFLKELAAKLPALAVKDATVKSLGGGLFEIKAIVTNEGYLPTALAQGTRTGRAFPVLVRLKAGSARLLAGKPLDRIPTVAGSGGRKEYRWLLLAPEQVKAATLEVSCPQAGRVVKELPLK
jgi:hypothetical protein